MATSAFTAKPTFKVIFLGEHNKALRASVIIVFIEIFEWRKLLHLCKIKFL